MTCRLCHIWKAPGHSETLCQKLQVAGVDVENAATRHGSKVFMNRLVEQVAGPMIWIVNDTRAPRPGGGSPDEPRHAVPQAQPRRAQEDDRAHFRSRQFRLDADETAKLARLRAAPALIAARHSWEIAGQRIAHLGRSTAIRSPARPTRRTCWTPRPRAASSSGCAFCR